MSKGTAFRGFLPILALLAALLGFIGPVRAGQPETRPGWWSDARVLAAADGYSLAGHAELVHLLDDVQGLVLLDVRPGYEFDMGALPGAVNLEFDLGDRHNPSPDKLTRLKEILGPDRARTVVVYCRSFR